MANADLVSRISDLKEDEALEIVRARLDAGAEPVEILEDCRKALEIVGKRFSDGEYFIPDLVYSGEISKSIADLVKPRLTREHNVARQGKIVVGTVAGDIHDIGKNIVTFLLDVNGFDVHDIGVDAAPSAFVAKLRETGAGVLALSGFLTLAFDSMKETIEAIAAAGLRDKVRIMIGGGQMNEDVRRYAGADAYGADAMAGVALARQWLAVE